MTLFLTTFFIIYGGMHLYFYTGLTGAYPLAPAAAAGLALFLALMVVAPVGERMLESRGRESQARAVAYTGYFWMGFLFVYCAGTLCLDLYALSVHAAGLVFTTLPPSLVPSPFVSFAVPAAVSLAANIWGAVEAVRLRTERITIVSDRIPANVGRLRIVQISDVHIGLIVRKKRLERIVAAAANEKPDVLAATGDLLDGETTDTAEAVRLLQGVKPRYGKFAVLGNHEFFAGVEASVAFLTASGFTILRGATAAVRGVIQVAGVDDPMGRRSGPGGKLTDRELLSRLRPEGFTLFLKHQPVVERGAEGLFDLQLSGHTHKGQLFPFGLVTRLVYPFNAGYFALPPRSHLYVSRGAGTWGPPVRILAPPEIAVIDLVRKA